MLQLNYNNHSPHVLHSCSSTCFKSCKFSADSTRYYTRLFQLKCIFDHPPTLWRNGGKGSIVLQMSRNYTERSYGLPAELRGSSKLIFIIAFWTYSLFSFLYSSPGSSYYLCYHHAPSPHWLVCPGMSLVVGTSQDMWDVGLLSVAHTVWLVHPGMSL